MNIEQEQKYFLQEQKRRNLSASTQQKYKDNLVTFLEWLQSEKIKLQQVQYTTILEYVRHCKKRWTAGTINKALHILQQYFAIKVKQGMIKKNPTIGIKVRGTAKRVPHDLLDRSELDKLYEDYPAHSLHDKRNKVILGLLVFQGLTTGDIKRLSLHHVKLNEGKLHVPGTPAHVHRGGINSRVLELRANQLLELHQYIQEIRPQLLRKGTDKLFVTEHGKENIQQAINWLSLKLRSQVKHYVNVDQLRASVITEWLKEKDVRIVQYMAGHKKVKSTEQYKAARLEDLQQALDQYHPMK